MVAEPIREGRKAYTTLAGGIRFTDERGLIDRPPHDLDHMVDAAQA